MEFGKIILKWGKKKNKAPNSDCERVLSERKPKITCKDDTKSSSIGLE